MSQNGEEEVEGTSTGGRPNAYWADVRAKQELEALREQGYGGDFRGIKMPKAGPKRVSAKETIGDYDTCWCGQPEGHDWPGKDKGRKHPKTIKTKEDTEVSAVAHDEAPSITRRELRAYHEDLIDVVMRAVNDYGVRYRLRNNGVLLYPPDGSTPYTINARNSDSQVRQARRWFVTHVVGVQEGKGHPLVKDPEPLAEDIDIREKARLLAEKMNSEEHPVPEEPEPETPSQRRARKAQERAEAAAKATAAPKPTPPPKAIAKAVAQAREEAEMEPVGENREAPEDFHVRETGDYEEGWRIYVTSRDEQRPEWETDGTWLRCRRCGWATTKANRMGGHVITGHNKEVQQKLWGPEAQEKKRETRARHRLETQVEKAVDLLNEALGRSAGDSSKLEKTIARLTAERDQWKAKAEETQARLDLMREALRA